MKNKLYGASGLCIVLVCIFADGKSPWPALSALAAAFLFMWAADRAPAAPAKRPAGPHKRRARARRRAKMMMILAVLVAVGVESSLMAREVEPVRTLPGASALSTMLNMQKYSPAEMDFNIEDWPELERVFKSGMDATALVGKLEAARLSGEAAGQFMEGWPELAYLLDEE